MFLRWGCRLRDRLCAMMLVSCVATIPTISARAGCTLGRMAEFPITMTNLRPLMTAKINGVETQFLVDSGAFYSMLSGARAAELNLRLSAAPFGFSLKGADGGQAAVSIATVAVFTLAGVPLRNIDFLVGGTDVGAILGQNILHIADVEYDLGQGFVRLMKPRDCSRATLAYWTNGTATPYSVIAIAATTPQSPYTTGSASVNGTPIRVLFDTGAGVSLLSLRAAARVGIKPGSPGVVFAGSSYGIGRNAFPSYVAHFSSFKIGGEEIQNTRLRIADIDLPDADMLIGADFFLSHRVYVANSQRKLYFTYNGGPVFNLSGAKYADAGPAPTPDVPATEAPSTTPSPTPPPAADATPDGAKKPEAAGDAADYSRRGAVQASRRDYERALANFTRACELAPDHPEYFYQRAMVHWQLTQGAAALADLDQTLKLKPDDIAALIARAQLSLQSADRARAHDDLDAASALASKQADVRYTMANAYQLAGVPLSAIAQYELWIASHADDARLPEALAAQCRLRALAGVDLALALKDCGTALKRAPKLSPSYARVAESRGLVLLRMGDYDKSIVDYDKSLAITPQDAWSWYGRGIDQLRKQRASEGQADIARATALSPRIAEEFSRLGIAP